MVSRKAFTLVEMLAVVAILLVLLSATLGMFNLFAGQSGPAPWQTPYKPC